ncbi:tRNA CCA-pyrophosphorylase [Buchnera aphidicola (Muscaphis stroyani)]|uniref:CCA-adding enzyme n=1 Tax=Buchnera aphidicola (Muscaphis stroyani) TaxID=1241869 RepID=A0A4D6Y6T7_9GAMM|nr:tRNA CCA-pyrophosphorylase [Buchnera aphidicola]QCI24173.1 tRNA CCA-pyrophosphorylase [Buchnera aphidicola (Muscaphis stroyani)]
MKIYLVGGAVRDSLLNLPFQDKDWVVVGGTKKMLLDKNFQQVGKDFPVFLHPKTHEEYALARTDRKNGVGYFGFNTISNKDITLEEDLIRRDLTINAIAQDENGNYIDPFQGIKDIKYRLLRHVSESFIEDPLRILRTARFAASLAHLGFCVAKETIELMKIMVKKKELSYLTSNRIWNETKKALKTFHPHVYFQILNDCKALKFIFPEIHYFCKKNFFLNFNSLHRKNRKNPIMGLSKISSLNKDVSIRFSYLCQFVSSSYIDKNFFNSMTIFHDSHSAYIVKKLCQRLNVPSNIRDIAVLSAGFYNFLSTIHYQSSKNIVILLLRIDAWRKPDRVNVLSFLSNFNSKSLFQSHKLYLNSHSFLKIAFSIIQNISIQSILNKGFKGYEIKKELNRLRVKKLDLWRSKYTVKYNF